MSQRPILVLAGLDVWNITSRLSVPEILQTIESALTSFSKSSENLRSNSTPHRSTIQAPKHTTLFMPSRVDSLSTTSVKVVAISRDGGDGGLPATTLVMDEQTGGLNAVVNARTLTALRTAAASTLATKLCLGSNATPTHLLLFGAGAQSNAHAALLIVTFKTIRHCTVVNRSHNDRLVTLLAHFRLQFPTVEFVGLAGDAVVHGESNTDIERAVRVASIICTSTSSTTPLFPAEWVPPHTHINLIGSYTPRMHEVSSELLKRANIIIVDSRDGCAQEAGELIAARIPVEKTFELGELGSELDASTISEGDVSVYKSVGVGVMDVAVAKFVVEKARELGFGVSIPYD